MNTRSFIILHITFIVMLEKSDRNKEMKKTIDKLFAKLSIIELYSIENKTISVPRWVQSSK